MFSSWLYQSPSVGFEGLEETTLPIMISGLKSCFITSVGKLLYIPPSYVRIPLISRGLNMIGKLIEALTASPKSPFLNIISFLLYTSDATQRNGTNNLSKLLPHAAVARENRFRNARFI